MLGYLRKAQWSPYIVGIGIGMLSLCTFYFMERALATSTSFVGAAGAGVCAIADATHTSPWWFIVGLAIVAVTLFTWLERRERRPVAA